MPEKTPSPRPPVVAILDTGLNPYHAAFAALPGRGAETRASDFDATPVRLAMNGSFDTRLEEDEAFWEGVELGRLYAFEGTRLLGISFGQAEEGPPILDPPMLFGHGTRVASLVAREAPEAILIMIQIDPILCMPERGTEQCPVMLQIAEALAWAAEQPWIDVISVSLGLPGNPPAREQAAEEVDQWLAAAALAHARGKTLVVAAGNTAVPPWGSHVAGPPHVIAVGGFQPAQNGEAAAAAKGADFLANNTDVVADFRSTDQQTWSSGTSMAAPIVAGTLANALHQVRAGVSEDRIAERDALRAALNASAHLVAPWGWDTTKPVSNDSFINYFERSLPVLTPTQQGWGYVHGGLAEEIARRMLEDDLLPPPEKALTAAYMAQHQGMRERYWSVGGSS